jgi:hypothetical protein
MTLTHNRRLTRLSHSETDDYSRSFAPYPTLTRKRTTYIHIITSSPSSSTPPPHLPPSASPLSTFPASSSIFACMSPMILYCSPPYRRLHRTHQRCPPHHHCTRLSHPNYVQHIMPPLPTPLDAVFISLGEVPTFQDRNDP